MKAITGYSQYKNDIFNKLAFHFEPGKRILDVGCGDASDAEIFIKEFDLDVYGIDVYKHENVDKLPNLHFLKADIFNIPHDNDSFDYVFLHDVLHHIDENEQSRDKHMRGLAEIKRVTRKNGVIIIIEGNRYNPLFYPHMVKMLGHEHWKQSYFINTMQRAFQNVEFKHFEAHAYPWALSFWKVYEYCMENFAPEKFLAYNAAIIKND